MGFFDALDKLVTKGSEAVEDGLKKGAEQVDEHINKGDKSGKKDDDIWGGLFG